jgi:hypothetical protein
MAPGGVIGMAGAPGHEAAQEKANIARKYIAL